MQTFQDDIMKLKLLLKEMEEKFEDRITFLENKVEFLEFEICELKKQLEIDAKG